MTPPEGSLSDYLGSILQASSDQCPLCPMVYLSDTCYGFLPYQRSCSECQG